MKQKSVPASAKPNHSNIAEKVDNGTQRDSSVDSSRSTKGTPQGKHTTLSFSLWLGLLTYTILDPIILSDDESTGAESEPDHTDPDVNLTDNSYPDSSHVQIAS